MRTAACEKWPQSPWPTVNPSRRKAAITISFVAVSTFCSAATRAMPARFTMVKTATMAAASQLGAPETELTPRPAESPRPAGASDARAGKKNARYAEIASAAAAIGAEKPAKKLTHPSMNPHAAPHASDKYNVLAPRSWKVHAELRVTQGSGECEDTADDPDADDERRIAEIAGEKAGRGEDADPDHVGDDERCGTEGTQLADEAGLRHVE